MATKSIFLRREEVALKNALKNVVAHGYDIKNAKRILKASVNVSKTLPVSYQQVLRAWSSPRRRLNRANGRKMSTTQFLRAAIR